MPAVVVEQITDVLRDSRARASAFGYQTALDFPFDVAAKTGTSKAYRDNWVAGYTDDVTVAVNDGGMAECSVTGMVREKLPRPPESDATLASARRARPESRR